MIQPIEIIQEVKKRPPLQRIVAEESYRGIKISWKLQFISARRSDPNRLKISTIAGIGYPWVYFEVDSEKYPEFNILKENQNLWVDGEIANVQGHNIFLRNCVVKFKKEETRTPAAISSTFVNSQLHFGHGDNIGRDKTSQNNKGLSDKFFWPLTATVVGGIILLLISLLL